MCISGENLRISDEAERVQSVSYPHVRSLLVLYTVVCLMGCKRGTSLGSPFLGARQGISRENIPFFGEKFIIRTNNIFRSTS